MLGKLAAYVIAFVVLAGIALPFLPIMITLCIALKKVKSVAPCLVSFLHAILVSFLDAIQICCAVLLAAWLIHKIGQSPSWLMFLIPGCLMLKNDLMRINHVKAGRSNVKLMLEQGGEPESYDQRHDLWVERGHLFGHFAGWIVGTSLILQSARFF